MGYDRHSPYKVVFRCISKPRPNGPFWNKTKALRVEAKKQKRRWDSKVHSLIGHIAKVRPRIPAGLVLGLRFYWTIFGLQSTVSWKTMKMNSPSGPSEKRDHGDYRSYVRPVVDRTARRQSADNSWTCRWCRSMQLPLPQPSPWPMGPPLIELSAAVIKCCCRVKNHLE